jgi:GT2 family glycosyltransferase
MVTIAVLLTCFNRKTYTVECLKHLFAQNDQSHFSLAVYLVDDGCTDGTAEAVLAQFPSVNIIQGTGELFWNGGMRLAWQTALLGDYDFYLWLNDDSMLYPDAIKCLLDNFHYLHTAGKKPGAIAATLIDLTTQQCSYGGRKIISHFNQLKTQLIQPSETPQQCDFMNGNTVLIPASTVKAVGILSDVYKHGFGDFDYSRKLINAGFSCWIAKGILGNCSKNNLLKTYQGHSIRARLSALKNIERLFPYKDQMHFVKQCSGKFWPIWWFKAWLRGNIPLLWVIITRDPKNI